MPFVSTIKDASLQDVSYVSKEKLDPNHEVKQQCLSLEKSTCCVSFQSVYQIRLKGLLVPEPIGRSVLCTRHTQKYTVGHQHAGDQLSPKIFPRWVVFCHVEVENTVLHSRMYGQYAVV